MIGQSFPQLFLILIASLVHEINRAYCAGLGDDSQPTWEDAPDWQKNSAVAGVKFHLENPDAPASASHDSWLRQKEAEGWVYGEVKDAEAKTHPCMVPFDKLPTEQQVKDFLFKAGVHAAKRLVDSMMAAQAAETINYWKEKPLAELAADLHGRIVSEIETTHQTTDHLAVSRDRLSGIIEILSR